MSVTLHTNHGDVKIELFCDSVPRTAFNFLALAASGYYDGTLFHRNVKGFMLQGGDPTGTGKGGESIWGGHFPDEIRPENTHAARGVVSMASSGPGTTGSRESARLDPPSSRFPERWRHPTATVCAAHVPTPHRPLTCAPSSSAEFFITYAKQPHLDNNYTVFGKVIDGWDALSAIERVPTTEKHRPTTEVRLESLTIHANPLADMMLVFPTAAGPPDIQT
jgi:peptidyl-prolyl cis-trans isomerase-like 3